MTAASADLVALSQNFAAASGQPFAQAASALVSSFASQIAQMAQSMAPVKTGALRESIQIQQSGPLSATIGPQKIYGSYQEFGTATRGEFGGSAYTIRPKKPGGMLVFTIDGKKIVTRQVTHPGIRPHPYMRPAFERVVTPFGQSLAELGGSYVKYGPNAPQALGGKAA